MVRCVVPIPGMMAADGWGTLRIRVTPGIRCTKTGLLDPGTATAAMGVVRMVQNRYPAETAIPKPIRGKCVSTSNSVSCCFGRRRRALSSRYGLVFLKVPASCTSTSSGEATEHVRLGPDKCERTLGISTLVVCKARKGDGSVGTQGRVRSRSDDGGSTRVQATKSNRASNASFGGAC